MGVEYAAQPFDFERGFKERSASMGLAEAQCAAAGAANTSEANFIPFQFDHDDVKQQIEMASN
jgi:hypothetical protein